MTQPIDPAELEARIRFPRLFALADDLAEQQLFTHQPAPDREEAA